MIEQPLVTVGIPTYNRPEGLQRTLECIRNQTYRNLEIIVSDNCSTDCAVQTVIQQAVNIDSRIKAIRQFENIGPWNNFNCLPNMGSGKYFMWAADDDLWDRDFVEYLVDKLTADPSLILAMADSQYSLSDGMKLPYLAESIQYRTRIDDRMQRVLNTFRTHNYNNIIYGIFVRAALVGSNPLIVFENKRSGTACAALKIACRGPFQVFPEVKFYPGTYLEGYLKMARWLGVKVNVPAQSASTNQAAVAEKSVMFIAPAVYRAAKNTGSYFHGVLYRVLTRFFSFVLKNQRFFFPFSVAYHQFLSARDCMGVYYGLEERLFNRCRYTIHVTSVSVRVLIKALIRSFT